MRDREQAIKTVAEAINDHWARGSQGGYWKDMDPVEHEQWFQEAAVAIDAYEALPDPVLEAMERNVSPVTAASTGEVKEALMKTETERLRAALAAIANAEIPGVSGGLNGATREVAEFARRALLHGGESRSPRITDALLDHALG